MNKQINRWAFILAFACLGLFLLAIGSNQFFTITKGLTGLHPLHLAFAVTLVTLLGGVYGFSGAHHWKAYVRSVATVVLTLCLSVVIVTIIVMGNLFQFT